MILLLSLLRYPLIEILHDETFHQTSLIPNKTAAYVSWAYSTWCFYRGSHKNLDIKHQKLPCWTLKDKKESIITYV